MFQLALCGIREIVSQVASEVGIDSPHFSFAPATDLAFGDFTSDVLLRVAGSARASLATLETRTMALLDKRNLNEVATVVRGFINIKLPDWLLQFSLEDDGLAQAMGREYSADGCLCVRVGLGGEPLSSWGRARLAALAAMHALFAAWEGSKVTVDVLTQHAADPIVVASDTDEGELLAHIYELLSGEATLGDQGNWQHRSGEGADKVVLWTPRGGRSVSGQGGDPEKHLEGDTHYGHVITPFVARRWLENPGQQGGWSGGGPPDFGGIWQGRHSRALAWYLVRGEDLSLLDPYVALFAESANWIWFSGELVAELDRVLRDGTIEGLRPGRSNAFWRVGREAVRLPWVLRYGAVMAQPIVVVATIGRLLDLTCQLLTSRGMYIGPVASSLTGDNVPSSGSDSISHSDRYGTQILHLVRSQVASLFRVLS